MKTEGYVITDCRNRDMGDVYFMYKNKELAERDLWTFNLMGSYNGSTVEPLPMIDSEENLEPIPDMVVAIVHLGLGTGKIDSYIRFASKEEFNRKDVKIGDVCVLRVISHIRSDHYLEFLYALPWIPIPEDPSNRNGFYASKAVYEIIKKRFEDERVPNKLLDLILEIHKIRLTVQQTGSSNISINMDADLGDIELVDEYGQLTANLFIGLMECFKREFGAAINHILNRYMGCMIMEDTEIQIFNSIRSWMEEYNFGNPTSTKRYIDILRVFQYYLRENKLPGKYVKPW